MEQSLVLQVYDAVLSAATPTTVELATPGAPPNTSAPHGRLLSSNLYETNMNTNNAGVPHTSDSSSGTFDATLYALNMELSSGGLRNGVDVDVDVGEGEATSTLISEAHARARVLIGVHFANLVPANLTDHVQIQLDNGVVLDSDAKKMARVPGNAQGQLVVATLPAGYAGQVWYHYTCICIGSPRMHCAGIYRTKTWKALLESWGTRSVCVVISSLR